MSNRLITYILTGCGVLYSPPPSHATHTEPVCETLRCFNAEYIINIWSSPLASLLRQNTDICIYWSQVLYRVAD